MKGEKSRFPKMVYELVTMVPAGKVTTYGLIAKALSEPKASRAVGATLRANPHPIVVPCHRVVMSDGRLGGFGGMKGVDRKVALLKSEGVHVTDGRVDLAKYLFRDF